MNERRRAAFLSRCAFVHGRRPKIQNSESFLEGEKKAAGVCIPRQVKLYILRNEEYLHFDSIAAEDRRSNPKVK
jgi:hypothetical protein